MFQPSAQAQFLLKKRYYKNDEDWTAMCRRVAGALSVTDEQSKRYFDVLSNAYFLPNTPCLVNAGKNGGNGVLGACFILPIEDSIESIYGTIKEAALIFKSGGGCGYDFSKIRPEGSPVASTNGVAGGPISFLKVFNSATQGIKQGSVRNGANMGSLRVDHPDIIKFIKCKDVDGELSSFNISVGITDHFMEMLHNSPDQVWECVFNDLHYNLLEDGEPKPCESGSAYGKRLSVSDVWNKIIDQAWKNGDPGILFIDEMMRKNGADAYTTNPCGEVGGGPYTMCVLGSIDVSKFVIGDTFDDDKMEEVIKTGVEMLNSMVDKSDYPLSQIKEKELSERKIGFGVMGFADALLKMRVTYGSDESLHIAEGLMGFIKTTCNKYSKNNVALTAIAPTGSISMLAGCSSGIEPNFAWETTINREDFEISKIVHRMAEPFIEKEQKLPPSFITSDEVAPSASVKMQSMFQKYVDLGVSKTVILSHDSGVDDIDEIYRLAWKLKCKGITVYRDGSRKNQVLSKTKKTEQDPVIVKKELTVRNRPRVLWGATYRVLTPAGKCFITINEDELGVREAFVHVSKAGSEIGSHVEVEGRLISNSLKYMVPVGAVIGHLKDQKSNPVWEHGRSVKSVPDAIAKVIEDYIQNYEGLSAYLPEDIVEYDGKKVDEVQPDEVLGMSGGICNYCGEPLYYSGGCEVCRSCGNSTCG